MKYVVAVSGGVDSMVLMNMLVNNQCPGLQIQRQNLVIAHFDHGIREDSLTDEKFVRGVVGEYELTYEYERAELGPDVSEETARDARYNFLRRCCKKYKAQLVTAHHRDDVVETMIINIIRGTGWRGLVSLDSGIQTIRPFLSISKKQILEYASEHRVPWKEDSTNTDMSYLRNYVRHTIVPALLKKDSTAQEALLEIQKQTTELKIQIATELQKIISKYQSKDCCYVAGRYDLIMYSPLVSKEIIYNLLTKLDPTWHPSSLQIERALHFIKTGSNRKKIDISGSLKIELTTRDVQFKKG